MGPERVLEGRTTYFSRFFRARALAVLTRSDKRFVWKKPYRNTCRPVHVRRKKRSKIDPGAFRTEVTAKNVPKMILGRARLDFGGVWAPPGRLLGVFWAFLGVSWALLGASWALLGCLLGAHGGLLGASWLSWTPPASILGALGGVRAGFGEASSAVFCRILACRRWIYMMH